MNERPKTTLTDGSPVTADHRDINPKTGLQKGYVVLSEEERAKGFVRPVRDSYMHIGRVAPPNLRDLTEDEQERYADSGYAKYQPYEPPRGSATGRFWSQEELDRIGKGCGATTTMTRPLAETYAREPSFYSGTYCSTCRTHFPVGQDGEFVWAGTDERVGS